MKFLDQDISPLGMGCWPIGGKMYAGDQSVGYGNVDDGEAIRTLHAVLDAGITLFDTAAAYGAGHAERLLCRALKNRSEALIATKIGIQIDEGSKQLVGDEVEPDTVIPAIDRCLARLGRDRIDLLLLHQNALPIPQAEAIFEEMEAAQAAGKIRAFGWSTDFADPVRTSAQRDGFVAVEHAMNVLVDAPRMQTVVGDCRLTALIRSPLAMGLLSGKYGAGANMPADDIRATANPKTDYFKDAAPNADFLARMDPVRDLLTSGGRSLTQGALAWLWAKNTANLPIPGVCTVEQITGVAEALTFGPLPTDVMSEIESLIGHMRDDGPDRAR